MIVLSYQEVSERCKKKFGVIVRWQGKTRGAFGFALIFLLHFLHQGKKWKTNIRKIISECKDTNNMRF